MINKEKIRHYEAPQWVDFVRGLVSESERRSMQAHLNAGCSPCRELAKFFAKVALRASADASFEVPEYAIHYARAIYALQKPEEVRLLPHIVAKLIYDSFRQPAVEGVRSQRGMVHHVLYEAGAFYLDVRLEHEQNSPRVLLLGQIANREQPDIGVANVPLVLLSQNAVISRAFSNRFGEFTMQYRPASSLRLYAPVPGNGPGIEVRLAHAFSAEPDGNIDS